nr:hypothetical protein [Tanacetum cinerariifolium]
CVIGGELRQLWLDEEVSGEGWIRMTAKATETGRWGGFTTPNEFKEKMQRVQMFSKPCIYVQDNE